MKRRIRFIINPRSGINPKRNLPDLIRPWLDSSSYEPDFVFTEYPKHAVELAKLAVSENVDVIAVAGGDGTVNEAAGQVIHTETTLAILPSGSGNGMARHVGMPLDLQKGIQVINAGRTITMDTFTVGSHFAIGTCGIGFDAHIAHLFSQSTKRGYATYVKLVLREFSKYPGRMMRFDVDGQVVEKNLFLLTMANSSQFGNNAVIAPFADVQDGLLDISMVSPFPVWKAPSLILRLMRNNLHQSKYFSGMTGKSILVQNPGTRNIHIDGEPLEISGDFTVQLVPSSLRIIVP